MTGYEAAHQAARTPPGDSGDGSSTQRLGPHPPRMEPQTGGFAAQGPAQIPAQSPAPAFQAHRPSTTSAFPVTSPAAAPSSAPTGSFPSGSGLNPQPPAPRRSLLPALTLFLVVLLTGAVVVQALMLMDTRDKYDKLRSDAAAQRTKELERRAGNTLDAAAVAGNVLPSVFRVTSQTGTGTGFAFANATAEGGTYVITNYHVIDRNWESNQKQVDLEQQNRRFNGQIVKVDEKADLAMIQTTEAFTRLAPAAEPAKPGQPVVVVGSPLGLEDSVTSGVVSALRTTSQGQVLQFDAPVNPGNSGGPIVNAQGQVVGVVNAKLVNAEGISLGIPVAVVCQSFQIC